MTTYSWWKMLRVLAGQKPGESTLPDTKGQRLETQPETVTSLLAEGLAVVLGVPSHGHLHEPIPAHA
ncbi:MAG: hypothetical protein ACJ8H8_21800 [Geminicoccaceae bacterium]